MTAPAAITLPHATAAAAATVWAVTLAVRARRRRLPRWRAVAGTLGVTLLALYAGGTFSGVPRPEQILEDISGALGQWTYLLVGVLAFLETAAFVSFIAPGEAAVVVGGVVAGHGEIDIRLLIGIVWLAAFAGDTMSFLLGRRLGRGFLERHGPRMKITEPRLRQVERYMREHGGKTVLIGRFVGVVRALAPFIAGSSRMAYRRFMPYDVIGCGIWAATFCMLGYVFANSLTQVVDYAQRGALIVAWSIGTIVLVTYLVRRFRDPVERAKLAQWLDAQERHPRRAKLVRPLRAAWRDVARPLARSVAPRVRFAVQRFTPGELGLEFTSALAIVTVAGYTLYFFLAAALAWPSSSFTNRINDAAFRVADSIRTDWLNSVAELVTNAGALWLVAPLAAAAVVYCLARRRVPEAVVLTVSLTLTVVLTHALKDWTHVPRPSGSLVRTGGWAFPSGHSAYAVSYVAIAVCFERVGGLLARTALVVAAGALTATVALSRVYLRAHYLSDAIGGVALGFLTAGALTVLALLAAHLRRRRRAHAAADAEHGDKVA